MRTTSTMGFSTGVRWRSASRPTQTTPQPSRERTTTNSSTGGSTATTTFSHRCWSHPRTPRGLPKRYAASATTLVSSRCYPSRYIEWHTVLPANYIGHLTSVVTEGVFTEYPDLTFVCIEGGFAWIPYLLWRLDKNWQALRVQTPWLEKPPSEYVREQVRFTTQPIEEPANPEYIRQILEMIHAGETVMFASDYPHWDNDSPEHGLPPLDDALRRAVMCENAKELYDLPDEPADL